jgi:hypothetical protein
LIRKFPGVHCGSSTASAAPNCRRDLAPRGEGVGWNREQRDPDVAPLPVHDEGKRRRGEGEAARPWPCGPHGVRVASVMKTHTHAANLT